jgi:hypothetical protein
MPLMVPNRSLICLLKGFGRGFSCFLRHKMLDPLASAFYMEKRNIGKMDPFQGGGE